MQDPLEIEFNKTLVIRKATPQQPVDLYLDFDPAYFATKEDEQHHAAAYHELLRANRTTLNDIINKAAKPKDLPQKFYAELTRLAHQEKTPCMQPLGSIESIDFLNRAGIQLTEKQKPYVEGRIFYYLLRCLFPMYYPTQEEHEFEKNGKQIKKLVTKFDQGILTKNPHNNTCIIFAVDYLNYVTTLNPQRIQDVREIIDMIGTEGPGPDMFWSLAQYINANLQQMGNTPSGSMDKIFRWIRCAYNEAHKVEGDFSRNYFPETFFAKIGVYKLKEPLGYDERMPTHLRARLLSKIVAQELD